MLVEIDEHGMIGHARVRHARSPIGIEIVGRARLPAGFKAVGKEAELTLDELRGRRGIYDEPTAAQNQSLSWLVSVLQEAIRIDSEEVFRHPLVSRKNPTEAQGANWKMQVPTP
ncbi:hypothetical protein [Variovorax sp. 160MFSha2.1]|uniref:hypothetical protein n=1 Tax=Variovorax sp. 160MFSha2.1 TaxID=3158367 RepID=UPI003AB0AC44